MASEDSRCRFILEERNRGKGAAVRTGILASSGDRILFLDADLSAPIEELPKLLRALDRGAEVAIGSRRMEGADVQVRQGIGRFLSGRFFFWVTRVLTGLPFRDTQCGFKLFTRLAAQEIFPRAREDGWSFDVEILSLARERGLETAEVPIVWRDSGGSRVRAIRDAPRTLLGLLRLGSPSRLPSVHRRQIVLACAGGILAASLLRGASLGLVPLTDPTEGRYASIALDMARSGDWLTPRSWFHGEYLPFWGKPPLHLWATALSFKVFGATEWAARFPSYLGGLGLLALVFLASRTLYGATAAALTALVASSAALFFVLWGTVVLDVTTALCVTGALVSFLLNQQGPSERSRRRWGCAGFAWLGLGMLAKGPVALVLSLFPILGWRLLARRRRPLAPVPWARGLLLFLGISAPWYLLAERTTPGFLRYFLVHEHLLRYLTPDYGDLYGNAHVYPRGSIWWMLLLGFLPWTLLPFLRAGRLRSGFGVAVATATRVLRGRKRPAAPRLPSGDPWRSYLVLWGLCPALFFTLARSVLPTYLLPGFGGLAILSGRALWKDLSGGVSNPVCLAVVAIAGAIGPWLALDFAVRFEGVGGEALLCLAVAIAVTGVIGVSVARRSLPALLGTIPLAVAVTFIVGGIAALPMIEARSARAALQAARANGAEPETEVELLDGRSGTALFYGRDHVLCLPCLKNLDWSEVLGSRPANLILVEAFHLHQIPPSALARLRSLGRFGPYLLYAKPDGCAPAGSTTRSD